MVGTGDHRSLLHGINRADEVGSSGVERVGAWAERDSAEVLQAKWAELKGAQKEKAKETGRTGLCPGLAVPDYYYSLLTNGEAETQNYHVSTRDPSLFEVESALHCNGHSMWRKEDTPNEH